MSRILLAGLERLPPFLQRKLSNQPRLPQPQNTRLNHLDETQYIISIIHQLPLHLQVPMHNS